MRGRVHGKEEREKKKERKKRLRKGWDIYRILIYKHAHNM